MASRGNNWQQPYAYQTPYYPAAAMMPSVYRYSQPAPAAMPSPSPAAMNLTPAQQQALATQQVTPEMAQELLKNPAIQAQMQQVMQDPTAMAQLQQMMQNSNQPSATEQALAPLKLMGMQDGPKTPGALLKVVFLALLMGVGFGQIGRTVVSGIENPTTRTGRFIHWLEQTRPVRGLNSIIENTFTSQNPRHFFSKETVSRLESSLTQEQYINRYIQQAIGLGGALHEDLKRLNLPFGIMNRLETATTHTAFADALNSPLVPKSTRGEMKSLLGGLYKRLKHFDNDGDFLKAEHTLNQKIAATKGPLTRVLAKQLEYINIMFPSLRSFNLVKHFSGLHLMMCIATLFSLGAAANELVSKPKGKKVSSFFDTLATGLSSCIGFELARRLVRDSGLLTRWNGLQKFSLEKVSDFSFIGRFMRKTTIGKALLDNAVVASPIRFMTPAARLFLRIMPSWGGFLEAMVIPSITLIPLLTFVTTKPLHWLFGNPNAPTAVVNKSKSAETSSQSTPQKTQAEQDAPAQAETVKPKPIDLDNLAQDKSPWKNVNLPSPANIAFSTQRARQDQLVAIESGQFALEQHQYAYANPIAL